MAHKPVSRHAAIAACAGALVALAGCAAGKALDTRQNAGPCPTAASLYDVSRYVAFPAGADERFNNITFSAEITDVRLFCRYVGEAPIVAEMEIDFAFGRGAEATGLTHSYPFFVSVTRRNRTVLEKEAFAVTAEFAPDQRVTSTTVRLEDVVIPRYDDTISGANFEIFVGFELTEQQLAFNRAGKRFRLDAASTLE